MAPLPRQSVKAGQEARKLEDIYAPIAKDLALNEEQIRKALGSGNDMVAEMVAHVTQNMGKRVRSALVLLCNQAPGPALTRAGHDAGRGGGAHPQRHPHPR